MSSIVCPTCKTSYSIEPPICANCGYPFNATKEIQAKFIADQITKKGHIRDTKDQLKMSRNILFAIAFINLIWSGMRLFLVRMDLQIYVNSLIGMIFLFFAFFIKKKPLVSVVIPLVLLLSIYAVTGLINPLLLVNGIIWKVIFVSSLTYSIIRIRKSEQIKQESDFLGSKTFR